MTQDQVKSELKELRNLIGVKRDELLIKRYFELRDKYEIAIKQLKAIDQLIFGHRIFQRKTYIQVCMALHYSEDGIRKRWSNIIKQLAEILTKPKTNFDRITESTESLAKFIEATDGFLCNYVNKKCHINGCVDCIKEWLQKENEQ